MAKEKITDSRKNEVLTNIGEYIKTKMNPDPSLWFPNKMANATIGFLRYTNVEIEIRVNTHKFNNGNKLSNVDIHVWVKKNDLLQQFRGLEQQFKDKVTEPAECEWSGNNVLVHYHVPIKWERWETLDDANKNKVSDAFMAISEILSDSGIDLGGPMKKSGNKRSVGEVGAFAFRNLIVFGAPGTGKSHYLDSERVKKMKDVIGDSDSDEGCFARYERVTFYPTYSYAQFVGSYKPVMKDVDKDGFELDPANGRTRKAIAYEFVPGPFLRILKDALLNKGKNYLLIIEEINRANAAAVFGDVFQLLDRNDDGKSEYSITSSREMIEYLERKIADDKDGVAKDVATELRIPSNLYIWATMNSADQGVFPLDTAFKRRWDFKYRSLDDNTSNDGVMVVVGDYICKWGALRKAINEVLKRSRVSEDKLLSSSFVCPDIISVGRVKEVISAERFEMKVLMYLWEDAARMCRQNVFSDDVKVLSDLIKAWNGAKFDDVEEPDPEGKKPKRGVLRAGLNLGDTKFDFFEKEKPAEDKGQEEDAEPQPPPQEKPAEAPAEAPAAQTPAAEAPAAEGKAGEEEKEAHPAEETDKGQKKGEEPQVKD